VTAMERKIEKYRRLLTAAQARNYDLRHKGEEYDADKMKARIDYLEAELDRVRCQRDDLKRKVNNV